MTVSTPNKGYPLLATGDQSGTWGVTINDDVFSVIDNNLSGRQSVALTTGTTTLSASQAENFIYTLSGSISGDCTLAWPATAGGQYIVKNGCTMNGHTITLKATGGTGVTIPASSTMCIYVNPTTTVTQDSLNYVTSLTAGSMALTTALPIASGGTSATTAAAAATALGLGTGNSPQFTAVNIGAASDTTVARVSAGVISVEGDTVAMLATANAFTAAQTVTAAGPGTVITAVNTAAASSTPGPNFTTYRAAVPVAGNALGRIIFDGQDSGGTRTSYSYLQGNVVDPTDGSEDGAIAVVNLVAGAFSTVMALAGGVYHPSATGTDKGVNTLNYGTIYENGTSLVAKYSLIAGSSSITTVGTITSGVWNGTDIAVADGGTGSSTAAGAATNLGLGTGNSPQFTAINLNSASDTTITRVSAGVIAVEGDTVAMLATANAFTAAQSITVASGTALTLSTADAGAGSGPNITLDRNSATPAANDILTFISFTGNDSGAATQEYGRIFAIIADPTAASEDGEMVIGATIAGTATNQMHLGNGVYIGVPTGLYKGTGSINAAAGFYDNGTSLDAIYQPLDSMLTDIGALAVTDGNIIVGNGATWVAESGATARTSLGLGTGDSPQFTAVNVGAATDTTITRVSAGVIAVEGSTILSGAGSTAITTVGTIITGTWNGTDVAVTAGGTGASDAATARTNLGLAIGTNVQAFDSALSAIAALAVTDSNIIVGNGATWVAESGATARTSLGVGTGDSPQFTAVNVGAATDTTISRVSAGVIQVEANTVYMENGTDVAIADGGTGQSTAILGARALLNGISTTLGSMLYHNGTSWVVLAKPVQSSVLTMDNSGIPSWQVP